MAEVELDIDAFYDHFQSLIAGWKVSLTWRDHEALRAAVRFFSKALS